MWGLLLGYLLFHKTPDPCHCSECKKARIKEEKARIKYYKEHPQFSGSMSPSGSSSPSTHY